MSVVSFSHGVLLVGIETKSCLYGKDLQLKTWTPATQVLLFNILIIPFIPFTTFSEINGILRFIVGMQIAIIWYAASKRMLRPLRYTTYWAFSCLFVIVSDYYVLSGIWMLPS